MKDYLQYMQDVLGVQNILLPAEMKSSGTGQQALFWDAQGAFQPSESAHYELVFLNIVTQSKETFFRPEVKELFTKMKAAMKLKNLQSVEIETALEDRSRLPAELAKYCEAKIVVVFSSFPKDLGDLIFKGPGKWIETYSPAYLLEDADAKKVVWNDLQKVMRELGL